MKTTRPNEPTFSVSKEMRRTYLILSHPWNALALSATVGNRLFRLLQTIKNNPACGKLLGIEADAFSYSKIRLEGRTRRQIKDRPTGTIDVAGC